MPKAVWQRPPVRRAVFVCLASAIYPEFAGAAFEPDAPTGMTIASFLRRSSGSQPLVRHGTTSPLEQSVALCHSEDLIRARRISFRLSACSQTAGVPPALFERFLPVDQINTRGRNASAAYFRARSVTRMP